EPSSTCSKSSRACRRPRLPPDSIMLRQPARRGRAESPLACSLLSCPPYRPFDGREVPMDDREFYAKLTRLLRSLRDVRPIAATVLLREAEIRMGRNVRKRADLPTGHPGETAGRP